MTLFNEKISLAEDFNTNIPIILDANKIILLPDFTPYHYRYNPKSIVNSINPKAFENVKELGEAWSKISISKRFESIFVESFIGNIIFEEINRICKSVSYSDLDTREIVRGLEICNGYYYLNSYANVRAEHRINLYNWLIHRNLLHIIKFLNTLNGLRY